VFFASVVSIPISVVLRTAKNLAVNTDLVGSLRDVDAGTCLVDFVAFCEVLLEIRFLRLFISYKSSSPGSLIPPKFCSVHHFVLPVHSPSGRPSVHSVLACICRRER
jgi:hypothetical protein